MNVFAHKILSKAMNSILNSQIEGLIKKEIIKVLQKLKYLIVFLMLLLGDFLGNFNAQVHNKNGPREIDIEIKKDSLLYIELTRKINCDTTLIINFQKES